MVYITNHIQVGACCKCAALLTTLDNLIYDIFYMKLFRINYIIFLCHSVTTMLYKLLLSLSLLHLLDWWVWFLKAWHNLIGWCCLALQGWYCSLDSKTVNAYDAPPHTLSISSVFSLPSNSRNHTCCQCQMCNLTSIITMPYIRTKMKTAK